MLNHNQTDQSRNVEWFTALVLTFGAGGVYWLRATKYIDLNLAWGGYSAMDWLLVATNPKLEGTNFPNGVGNYGKSLFMQLYPLGLKLGISIESMIPIVIGLEMLLMAAALFYLARTVFPKVSPLFFAVLTIIALWTSSRDMNLARFGQPFFVGLYYNAADALRLAAFAALLRRRVIFASFLLALAYTCHPTLGLMGGLFLGAAYLAAYKDYPNKNVLAAAVAFAVVSGSWTFLTLGDAHLSSGGIPQEIWLQLTHMLNFHWYPLESGVFTVLHELHFLPFMAFLTLLSYSFQRLAPLAPEHRQAAVAMAAMIPVVTAGIFISKFLPIPVLIKLSLHRANDMIITVGLMYVIFMLWTDLTEGLVWQRGLAAAVLFSFFLSAQLPVFPVALVLAYTSPAWLHVIKGSPKGPWEIATSMMGIALLLLSAGYYFSVYEKPITDVSYTGFDGVRNLWNFSWCLALTPLVLLLPHAKHVLRGAAIAILVLAFSIYASVLRFPDRGDTSQSQEQLYLEAQLWARYHTPETTLFISDPGIYYGWRDYSHRALFGNMRDWLHNSWLYTSDRKLFDEGMRRFHEFGVDLEPYLEASNIGWDNFRALSAAVRRQYYAMSDTRRLELASKYGISYFVFDKSQGGLHNDPRVVFENERFQIVRYRP